MAYEESSLKQTLYEILNGLQSEKNLRETGEGLQRLRQSIPGVAESVARGAIASVPGSVGDISAFAREYAPETMESTFGRRVAPTTREILDYVPRITPTHEGATTLEDVGAAIAPGVGGVAKDVAMLTKGKQLGLSIMGPESALWKPEMAFQAGRMEAKGAPAEEILQKTGMVRGLDNQWRMELSDQFSKMKQKGETFDEIHRRGGLNGIWSKGQTKVEDVLEHPDLFEAYPHLKNIEVVTHKADNPVRGSYNQKKNQISIREDLSPDEAKSVMLHELTHGIQAKEEFNRGANASQLIQHFAKEKEAIMPQIEALNKEASIALNAGDKDKYHILMAQRDNLTQKYISMNPEEMGYSAYLRHGGEAEARMVQNRMNLSPEELRQHFPYQYAPKQHGLDIYPDEAIITTQHPGTINQPAQSLEIKGYQDEGNYRRVGEPQSNLERFGITGANDQGRIPSGIIEDTARITRRSNPDEIAKQAEYIQANLKNPEFNKALALAKKHNPEFDIKSIENMPASSLEKQHVIGKTYDLLTKESVSPELKEAIFNDYMAKRPDLMEKEGIKNYDDLVVKSYGQLRKEIDQQFNDMIKSGVNLSYHQGDANYINSKEMLQDALINNHLYTYRGGDVHPLLNEMDPYYGLNSNEKFRAVHDYLGHATTGSEFGRKGEEIAYGAHAQTLSPLARIAAAAETRGQNSFVNYSGVNADLIDKMSAIRLQKNKAIREGESPEKYDEALRELGGQWQYAKQQGVALPPEMLDPAYKGNMPEYIKAHLHPEHGVSSKGYHYSNISDLEETDPSKYGYGIKGAEAKRLALPGSIKERTYFYNEPGKREPGLGKHQYEADLEHLYDIESDPAGIVKMATTYNKDKYGNVDVAGKANDIERMMREAGYHGYFNQNTGVGISFEPQKVREYSTE